MIPVTGQVKFSAIKASASVSSFISRFKNFEDSTIFFTDESFSLGIVYFVKVQEFFKFLLRNFGRHPFYYETLFLAENFGRLLVNLS